MNEVRIDGIVSRDPEFKEAKNFKIGKFPILNRDDRGNSSFFDIETWNEVTEKCQHLRKGDRALIIGYVKQDSWQDPEGKKRSRIKFVANSIEISAGEVNPYNTKNAQTTSTYVPKRDVHGSQGLVDFDDKLPF